MRLRFSSTSSTLTFTTSPTETTSEGWRDELVADLRNMHQAVLMHADIHKSAEIDDVAHRAAQLHAGLQVLQLQNIRAQDRRGQLVSAGRAPGFHKLLHNILHRRNANLTRLRQLLLAVELHARRELLQLLRSDI